MYRNKRKLICFLSSQFETSIKSKYTKNEINISFSSFPEIYQRFHKGLRTKQMRRNIGNIINKIQDSGHCRIYNYFTFFVRGNISDYLKYKFTYISVEIPYTKPNDIKIYRYIGTTDSVFHMSNYQYY